MKNAVRCVCLLAVLGFLFTACQDKDKLESELRETESKIANSIIKDSISSNNYERYDLLMTKYINDTKIYGISSSNGIYDKVQVEINGETHDYDWLSLGDDNYLPSIYYVNLVGDENNECVFILTDDLKDNYISQKVHVINPETFEEYDVADVKEGIKENLRYRQENEILTILLNNVVVYTEGLEELKENKEDQAELNGENTLEVFDPEKFLEKIKYDSFITYKVSGEYLISNVKFYLDDENIDTLDLTFKNDNDKLVIDFK